MAPSLSSTFHNALAGLSSRDLGDTVSQATGIHDWDSCMAHGYCKWPVIVGIIVVSLILLSILFCIVRCCGCCADCCRCLSCCGGRKTQYVQAPQQHAPPMYPPGGYGWQPHMAYGAGGAVSPAPAQFATFENSSAKSPSSTTKIHADSLPAMPSWSTARSKQVEDTSDPPEEETKPLRNNDELGGHGDDIAMARLNPSRNSPRPDYARQGSYNQVPQRALATSPGGGAITGAGAGTAYGGAAMYNDRDYNSHDGYDGYGQRDQGYGHGDQGYGGYSSPRSEQHQHHQPDPYEYNVGNPYSAQSPQSPTSNYTAGTVGFPPPSYRTQPPSRAYTPANGMDRSAYGSQNSRYAASSDYASTVGYQGAYAPQRQQQPRNEQNYSLPNVAEMPATRASHLPSATSPQSRQPPQELGGGSEWRPQNQMPAALTPGGGGGDWRSAGQRSGTDRKPVNGTWREV